MTVISQVLYILIATSLMVLSFVLPTAVFVESSNVPTQKLYIFEPEVTKFMVRDKAYDNIFLGYSAAYVVVTTLLISLSLFKDMHPLLMGFLCVVHTVLIIIAAPMAHHLHHVSYLRISADTDGPQYALASTILTGDNGFDDDVGDIDTRLGAGPIVGLFFPFLVYAKYLSEEFSLLSFD